MSGELTFAFLVAHLVAWLVMGRTWGAAFKAPIAVLIPALALLGAYAAMADGFGLVPAALLVMASISGSYLFGLLCLRIAIPKKAAAEAAG